jgi:cation-transporting ATPase I
MLPARLLLPLVKLVSARSRRAAISRRRAYVEYRAQIRGAHLLRFTEALKLGSAYLTRAQWFEVSQQTGRVVFAFEEDAYSLDELIDVVEAAEQAVGFAGGALGGNSFGGVGFAGGMASASVPDHPADADLVVQRGVELAADLVSTLIGFGLSLSPVPVVPLSGNAVGVLSILRGSPELRQGLEMRLGVERAELTLNLASAFAQAAAQRPFSSLVDALHKGALLREIETRRRLWFRREVDLVLEPSSEESLAWENMTRPIPLRAGPIEEYADRAWFVSLSGFALSFITTRSFQRATAALFGGLPRPARIGRDVFAAELGSVLAARGTMVLDRDVLRRLDRIDCLVLQGDLVKREHFVVASILAEDVEATEEARVRARTMFDQTRPLHPQVDGLWCLQPWEMSRASADVRLREHARERSRAGALVLTLERAGRVVAVVEVEILEQTGVEELISAAHEARLRVVIVAGQGSNIHGFNTDDVISEQEGVVEGIRRLQRSGHGVCLVATGRSPALSLADCAIGLLRAGEPVPWAADMICREDLEDVRFLILACIAARRVSRQCVNIALGAAAFGTLVSAGGVLPLTARRVMFVINMANLISMGNGVRNSLRLRAKSLPRPHDPTPWHALDARGVLGRLGTGQTGLTVMEARRRRPEAPPKRNSLAELGEAITDEVFNPLAPLLAAGAGLSAVTGGVTDAGMVAGVVGINAVVGGWQRFQTEQKLHALANSERRLVTVRRDGGELRVLGTELVVGDLLLLDAGDVVPADCRIISEGPLEVDASSITGESLLVAKNSQASFEANIADRSSMLYAGSAIASGSAEAVVVAVGDQLEAQRGATIVKKPRQGGGVEKRLRDLMELTGPVAIAAGIGVIGGGLLRGRKLEDLVSSGVSLAVASVPEGLPLLATAVQLAAAQRLAKQNALVRNVRAIEALGRVDVICLDKTGTLTEGGIDLYLVSDGAREELATQTLSETAQRIIAAGLRATSERAGDQRIGDPLDDALWRVANQAAVATNLGCAQWQRTAEVPFASARGYHAVAGQAAQGRWVSVKGAPEVLLPLCTSWGDGTDLQSIDQATTKELLNLAATFASRGLRVIAVAERELSVDQPLDGSTLVELTFRGFLIFSDPVRASSKAAIARLTRAGVRTLMITGDHPQTGVAVAMEIGLPHGDRVMTGAELLEVSDEALPEILNHTGVFARVTPMQKVRLVRALQRAGHVVAMVGDGVNDAPALRLADVGAAVGEHSTSAARAAADVVLVDGRVETLIEAIAEGRAMWSSVRDAVSILLGGNFGEIAFTLGAGLIDGRPPLNARQLLLVNLLTDVAPAMAIALRPPSAARLRALTRESPDAVLGAPLTRDIVQRAGITALGAGSAWTVARILGSSSYARTVGLAALVGTQLGQTLRLGGMTRPVLLTGIGSAGLMFSIIQTPGLSQFFGCRPLGPIGWATAIGASAAATGLSSIASGLFAGEWLEPDTASGGDAPLSTLSIPPSILPEPLPSQ